MHLTPARRAFLHEVFGRRSGLSEWLGRADARFVPHALPVFLHGGPSAGKIVVMGVNPGWRPAADERLERWLSSSPERYVAFHEEFYDHFQRFEPSMGTSHFWNNLRSKLVALRPDMAIDRDKWAAYRAHVVVQDLFPFHSWKNLTNRHDVEHGMLGQIADATIGGLVNSAASEVWAFSPEAHAAVSRATRNRENVTVKVKTVLEGCTSTGQHRKVNLLVADFERAANDRLRFIAVANALLTQPWFPFDKMFCSGERCVPRLTMAEQIRDACGSA